MTREDQEVVHGVVPVNDVVVLHLGQVGHGLIGLVIHPSDHPRVHQALPLSDDLAHRPLGPSQVEIYGGGAWLDVPVLAGGEQNPATFAVPSSDNPPLNLD